jgi:2-methylisocitrate lyase-like PEP mutase family enzyme
LYAAPDISSERLLVAGAAGCNFEDSDHSRAGAPRDPTEQAGRISALKDEARRAGIDLVINARIDVFLRSRANEDGNVAEAIRRGVLYRQAGADCVFPILIRGEAAIASLVDGIPGPVAEPPNPVVPFMT